MHVLHVMLCYCLSHATFLYCNRLYSFDDVETSALKYTSGLINGRGRQTSGERIPLSEFIVQPGASHRFRLVHTGAEFTLEVSIDEHLLNVVSTDGNDVRPVTVHSIIIFPGETVDFTVHADANPGLYWFRARTLVFGTGEIQPDPRVATSDIKAIVRYTGMETDGGDPKSYPPICSKNMPCNVFNCPFPAYPKDMNKICLDISHAHTASDDLSKLGDRFGLFDTNVEEIFINVAFSYGSSINGHRFVSPEQPVYGDFNSSIVNCHQQDCTDGCLCTFMKALPFGKPVQIVLSSLQKDSDFIAHHSMHLHGHSMAVVKVGYPEHNATTGRWQEPNSDIYCTDRHCTSATWNPNRPKPTDLNLIDPAIKDTVVVPARGYIVVRFRADNRGVWLFHCHQELHQMEGMMMIFIEGSLEDLPAPPRGMPTCNSFNWDADDANRRGVLNDSDDIYSIHHAGNKETPIGMFGMLAIFYIFYIYIQSNRL